jgi:release factor glutamine methyltransferase
VIAAAPSWLAPGGSLLFETSEAQAPAAVGTVAAAGLRTRVVSDDERGATVVVGTRD